MKKTYRNRLPKNKEVIGTGVSIENGELVISVELKDKFLPKDGNFLISSLGNVFIYSDKKAEYDKYYCCYCGIHDGGQILTHFSNFWTTKVGCRFATPEEKADFLKRLETEERLRWNAGAKKLEPIRWRAEFGENYFVVTNSKERNSFIVKEKRECSSIFDEENYQLNNYFRTPEAAQKVADQIINIFKNAKVE